jgi:hypothetical protein
MKLKDLIKESKYLKREFGESLPTLDSVMKQHQDSKESIKEASIPQFKKSDDVSYYYRDWGKIFDQLERFDDYGPRESDMYDWNNRSLYDNVTKEFHSHMEKVGKKLNSAVKDIENSYKVWDKILKKYRSKDRS